MDEIEKKLVCIGCPNSCRLNVTGTRDKPVISGNRCPKGAEFARAELICPMRCLTTTVKLVGGELPVLPVRTEGEIPKSIIPDAMKEISKIKINAPVECGSTVIENLLGTGVRLIATGAGERRREE